MKKLSKKKERLSLEVSINQINSTDRKKMFGIFDRTKVKIELDTGE
jgi:hypothetical protein